MSEACTVAVPEVRVILVRRRRLAHRPRGTEARMSSGPAHAVEPTTPTIDTLLAAMLAQADVRPNKDAIVLPGNTIRRAFRYARRITYAELRQRIMTTAARLREHGFVEGDAVLYAVRPGIDGMVLLCALLIAG